MAELKLNTTTSIVDFLKSQNKPSDFKSREKMFQESGLSDRLGPFVGSGTQNIAMLKRLQGQQEAPAPVAPAAPTTPPETPLPPQLQDIIPPGTSAADALKTLGISDVPTDQDLTSQVMESPAFKLFQEKQGLTGTTLAGEAEVKKGELEKGFVGDVKKVEENLAAKGMTFSGVKTEAIQGLTESLAASKLGVDRTLASKLLSQNLDLKEEVLKTVTQTVKDAQAGRKDAISALEKIGLTVIGNKIVPTLAAKAADLAQRKEERIAAGGGGGEFTPTQINIGAAAARMPIKEFQGLNDDDKNYFINRSSDVKKSYEIIDDGKTNNRDPYEIQKEINDSQAPDAVKNRLINYLKKAYPGVDITVPRLPWWKRLFGID